MPSAAPLTTKVHTHPFCYPTSTLGTEVVCCLCLKGSPIFNCLSDLTSSHVPDVKMKEEYNTYSSLSYLSMFLLGLTILGRYLLPDWQA